MKAAQTRVEAGENLNGNEGDGRHEVRRTAISSPSPTTSPPGSSASLDPHAAHLENVLVKLFSLLNNQTLVRTLKCYEQFVRCPCFVLNSTEIKRKKKNKFKICLFMSVATDALKSNTNMKWNDRPCCVSTTPCSNDEYYSHSFLMTSLFSCVFSLCAIGLSWSMLYMETLSPFLRPASLEPARDLSCWSVSWMVGSILLLEDIEVRDAGN